MSKRKLIDQPSHKAKLKIGTLIRFSFAGQNLMGKIKAIKVDTGYSVKTEWYSVEHEDGTIYPLRVEDESIITKPKHNN